MKQPHTCATRSDGEHDWERLSTSAGLGHQWRCRRCDEDATTHGDPDRLPRRLWAVVFDFRGHVELHDVYYHEEVRGPFEDPMTAPHLKWEHWSKGQVVNVYVATHVEICSSVREARLTRSRLELVREVLES